MDQKTIKHVRHKSNLPFENPTDNQVIFLPQLPSKYSSLIKNNFNDPKQTIKQQILIQQQLNVDNKELINHFISYAQYSISNFQQSSSIQPKHLNHNLRNNNRIIQQTQQIKPYTTIPQVIDQKSQTASSKQKQYDFKTVQEININNQIEQKNYKIQLLLNIIDKLEIQKKQYLKNIQNQKKQLMQIKQKTIQSQFINQKNKKLVEEIGIKLNDINSLKRQLNKVQKQNKNQQILLNNKEQQCTSLFKQLNSIKKENQLLIQQFKSLKDTNNIKNLKVTTVRTINNNDLILSPIVYSYRQLPNLAQSKQSQSQDSDKIQKQIPQKINNQQKFIEKEEKKKQMYRINLKQIPIETSFYQNLVQQNQEQKIQQLNLIIQQLNKKNQELKLSLAQKQNIVSKQKKQKEQKLQESANKIKSLQKQIKKLNQLFEEKEKKTHFKKIFQDQIIYTLKSENQSLKIASMKDKIKYQEKINQIQKNKLKITDLNNKNIQQILRTTQQDSKNNNQVKIFKHERNKSNDIRRRNNQSDQSYQVKQLIFYKNINKQLQNRNNQLIYLNNQLKLTIQHLMTKSQINSLVVFYKNQCQNKQKIVKSFQIKLNSMQIENSKLKKKAQDKSLLKIIYEKKFKEFELKIKELQDQFNQIYNLYSKSQQNKSNLIIQITNLLKQQIFLYKRNYSLINPEIIFHIQNIMKNRISQDYINQINFSKQLEADKKYFKYKQKQV